jgi:hypothetical protein
LRYQKKIIFRAFHHGILQAALGQCHEVIIRINHIKKLSKIYCSAGLEVEIILCPFAVYYLRYAVTSFFTMSRISLAEGKTAGQKVYRKIARAVQNVKPLYFLSPSFEIQEKYCQQSFFFSSSSNCPLPRCETEGFEREGLESER